MLAHPSSRPWTAVMVAVLAACGHLLLAADRVDRFVLAGALCFLIAGLLAALGGRQAPRRGVEAHPRPRPSIVVLAAALTAGGHVLLEVQHAGRTVAAGALCFLIAGLLSGFAGRVARHDAGA